MKVFIYGTLAESHVQQSLFGRVISMSKAKLKGFKIKKAVYDSHVTNYKTIAESTIDSFVEGNIIDLVGEEIYTCDSYEGTPHFYSRIPIIVFDENDNEINCQTYINTYLLKK
jgi:hypothetical protein